MKSRSHAHNVEWSKSRQYIQRTCDCLTHSLSNDICIICSDWSGNPPDITCAHPLCFNSYHIKCLDPPHQRPDSWNTCNEFDIPCHTQIPQRFSFGPQQPKWNVTRLQHRYGNKIRLDSPIAFYQSFQWNHSCYKIGDFIEVLTTEGTTSVAKIINIYLDKYKAAQCVVEWHWKSSEHQVLSDAFPNQNCLIFSECVSWYLACIYVSAIVSKASIHPSIDTCIAERTKIRQRVDLIMRLISNNKCIHKHYGPMPCISAYCLFKGGFNSHDQQIDVEDETQCISYKKTEHSRQIVDSDSMSEDEGLHGDAVPSHAPSSSAITQQIAMKQINVKQGKARSSYSLGSLEIEISRSDEDDAVVYEGIDLDTISISDDEQRIIEDTDERKDMIVNDDAVKKILNYMNDYWRVKRVGHIKMGELCTALNEQVFENGLCIKRLVEIIEYLFTKNRVFYVQNKEHIEDSDVHQL